jgi:hypothetical protein
MQVIRMLVAVAASWTLSVDAMAQDMLQRRAREAAALIAADPSWPEDLFVEGFRAQVPDERLKAIGQQYFAQGGTVVEVQQTGSKGEHAGTFDLIMEKGVVVPMTLAITDEAPNPIAGLLFGLPAPMLRNMDDAVAALGKLGGKVSFGVWELGEGDPRPLASLNPDMPLAIGSAFKLYVLGALVEEVRAGRRTPADVITLGADGRSIPSGQMQDWPRDAPVTLSTTANLMIAISDNTATDLLIRTLGRETVEAMLPVMGMADPTRTLPFLTTHEMIALKARDPAAAQAYAAMDTASRRAFLTERLPRGSIDPDRLDPSAFSRPAFVDSIEWFASAADLCRAMDWLRRSTPGDAGSGLSVLRGALAINRGLDIPRSRFPWVGFKGGSEPGVLNMTYLLQAADGRWMVLAATWNDTERSLKESDFLAIVQRAIWVLGQPASGT